MGHVLSECSDDEGRIDALEDFTAIWILNYEASLGTCFEDLELLITYNGGLIDLGFVDPTFTWKNRWNGSNNVQERLDKVLANRSWMDMFMDAKVEHLGFHSLDHRPLLFEIQGGTCLEMNHDIAFHFEPFWLKDEDLCSVVREVWGDTHLSTIVSDLCSKIN
ncbi:hypothetical protein Ddye_020775 [Dipteronia dyeriana]|uniref:Endonuclease/exonuclease/phosphatase domain-containing protein n=1 Tax=Dipteronia dyeriana TaxID=168575 RepID=A0AAD9U1F3_9ROSI|nr:hypothetical protein Ddye_020775 [Dipteronia dyeriana]